VHDDSDVSSHLQPLEPIDNQRFVRLKHYLNSHPQPVFPWILSTLFLIFFSVYLLSRQYGDRLSANSTYKTDLSDVRPSISYEERVFSGKLWYNEETGFLYRDIDTAQPQYFGEPSPEIDAAWSDLLRGNIFCLNWQGWFGCLIFDALTNSVLDSVGEFPVMTDEEAAPYIPELKKLRISSQYHFEWGRMKGRLRSYI
jgi:hypothetical protein